MTLKEVKDYIVSSIKTNGSRNITATVLQNVLNEIVNFFSTKGVITEEQSLTSSEKSQARKNISAVGIAPTSDGNILECEGKTIQPRTKIENVFKGNVSLDQELKKYISTEEQELTGDQKSQARKNIRAVSIATTFSNGSTLLMDENSQSLYPTTRVEYVENAIGKGARFGDGATLKDGENIIYPQTKAQYVIYGDTNMSAFADMVMSRIQALNDRIADLENK